MSAVELLHELSFLDCPTYLIIVVPVACCAGTSHRRRHVPFAKRVILTSYLRLQDAPQVSQKASKLSILANICDLRITLTNVMALGLACCGHWGNLVCSCLTRETPCSIDTWTRWTRDTPDPPMRLNSSLAPSLVPVWSP